MNSKQQNNVCASVTRTESEFAFFYQIKLPLLQKPFVSNASLGYNETISFRIFSITGFSNLKKNPFLVS